MKKLHSFAFYALVTPALALGASSALAEQSTGQNMDREQQSTQRDQGATHSGAITTQGEQGKHRARQSDSQAAADRQKTGEQSRMDSRSYMDSVPDKGSHASDLIGASVKTTGDNDVGSVSDLIIDEDGQVVAIVVGVGGFLGMGQKDVAISWDHVTRSGTADDLELRVDLSREDLRSAREFKTRE